MDSKKIGKFIAQLRKEHNMTQEDLAQKVFVDRSIVSKWERGVYIPKYDYILELSKIFDVTVNEIYYGEKQTEDNKEQVSEVTINIIKDHKKTIKRIFIIGITIIFMIILTFFVYYFINNYNSIKVYTITGENENYGIYNGLMIVSHDKYYIQLGKINNKNSVSINNIKLYFIKNGKEITIVSGNDESVLIANKFEDKSSFSYNDLKYIINDLYLEIKSDDKTELIKLKFTRDFANDKIFSQNSEINKLNKKESNNKEIPSYVKENFILDSENEVYVYSSKDNNKDISIKYYYLAEMLVVKECQNQSCSNYEYMIPNDLYYYTDDIYFTYNMVNNTCVSDNCNDDIVKYFKETYINKILS